MGAFHCYYYHYLQLNPPPLNRQVHAASDFGGSLGGVDGVMLPRVLRSPADPSGRDTAGAEMVANLAAAHSMRQTRAPDASAAATAELPLGYVLVPLACNIPSVRNITLDMSLMARAFAASVPMRWDDPAIVAMNPGALLPSVPIILFVPDVPSKFTAQQEGRHTLWLYCLQRSGPGPTLPLELPPPLSCTACRSFSRASPALMRWTLPANPDCDAARSAKFTFFYLPFIPGLIDRHVRVLTSILTTPRPTPPLRSACQQNYGGRASGPSWHCGRCVPSGVA